MSCHWLGQLICRGRDFGAHARRVARAVRLGHGPARRVTGDLVDGVLTPEDDAELDDAAHHEEEEAGDQRKLHQRLPARRSERFADASWARARARRRGGQGSMRKTAVVAISR